VGYREQQCPSVLLFQGEGGLGVPTATSRHKGAGGEIPKRRGPDCSPLPDPEKHHTHRKKFQPKTSRGKLGRKFDVPRHTLLHFIINHYLTALTRSQNHVDKGWVALSINENVAKHPIMYLKLNSRCLENVGSPRAGILLGF
jgi:hypothetical protein